MKYIGNTKSSFLKPDYIADSITDIDFNLLQSKKIEAIFIDLDGTVVERANYNVSSKISAILKSQPLKIYIATNRPKSRDLKNLKQQLHAQGVIHPKGVFGKPFPSYFKTALAEHGLKPSQAIMVGDRYIQDIIGANRAGMRTLVVRKLDSPTNRFDKILSGIEKKVTDRLAKRYRDC